MLSNLIFSNLEASDEIGNLANDGTWSYSWQHGRQLKQMSRPDASGDTEMIRFRYDSGGHRIGKDSGVYHASYSGGEIVYAGETTRTSYSYLGDTLTQVNISAPTGSTSLHFTYDEIGPMSVTYDGAEYFYLKNAQGDVTGLVNSSGTQVVAYTYDAWGNPLTTTGTMAGTLGKLNPFRYRGYVYDTETGLYYLQSRYYNPETGRFVNADGYVSTGQGVVGNNMFAYCGNNPAVNADDDGDFWHLIVGALVGVAIKYACDVAANISAGKRGLDVLKPSSSVASYVGAAASGALAASGVGIVGQAVGNAAISAATNVVDQTSKIRKDRTRGIQTNFSTKQLLADTTIGLASGLIGGAGASSVVAGAGGAKQMIDLGVGSIKRSVSALSNKGISAFVKESGTAATYYANSTIVITKNIFSKNTLKSGVLNMGYSVCSQHIAWE